MILLLCRNSLSYFITDISILTNLSILFINYIMMIIPNCMLHGVLMSFNQASLTIYYMNSKISSWLSFHFKNFILAVVSSFFRCCFNKSASIFTRFGVCSQAALISIWIFSSDLFMWKMWLWPIFYSTRIRQRPGGISA